MTTLIEGSDRAIGVSCGMSGSDVAGFEFANSLVRVNEGGNVIVTMRSSDIKQGAESVMAQTAAETLRVRSSDVSVISEDTGRILFDGGIHYPFFGSSSQ